jgi:hypothetical protein
MPSAIGAKVATHLDNYKIVNLDAVKEALRSPGKDEEWARFWRWNTMVDQYRKEKFADVFPEYYKILVNEPALV